MREANIRRDSLLHSPAALIVAVYMFGHLCAPIAPFDYLHAHPHALVQVLGNALPYGPWFNRAVFLGPLTLLAALVMMATRTRLSRPGFTWLDMLVVGWILSPAVAGIANPSPWVDDIRQSIYLALVWGATYAAGRVAYQSHVDLENVLAVWLRFGIISFLFALVEFVCGRFFYASLYGYHPFQDEGATRYVGFRPLLMFEDPNQVGMWWASIATIAVAGLMSNRPIADGPPFLER